MITDAFLITSIVLSAIAVLLILRVSIRIGRSPSNLPVELQLRLSTLESGFARAETSIRDEAERGREESSREGRALREEVTKSVGSLGEALRQALGDSAGVQNGQLEAFATQLANYRDAAIKENKELREGVELTLTKLGSNLAQKTEEQGEQQRNRLDAVTAQIKELTDGNERRQETLRSNVEAKLAELKADAAKGAKELREEVTKALQEVSAGLFQSVEQISQNQKERLDILSQNVTLLAQQTTEKQEGLRQTVEGKLDAIRVENAEKLEQMRLTVDEKLQNTLEQRLGASFKQVCDSLEQVYKSVGEMQALATGVGDLKKVLTNIKSRGTWGEVTLGNLLEQVLAPDQYGRNIEVQPRSNQRVEFAVRLPGDEETPVWLPIDAKFPSEDYDRLVDAVERGDTESIELASKALEVRIRGAARDISDKYVHPPHSTDFAVLFLPTEGLFAEIIRRPGLVDALQRDHHVMVAGPTTLATLLTALRMGFRSLAIQKRSNEVWKVLGAVKNEFSKFGGVIDKLGKKLDEAQKVLDDEVGKRRRAMDRKLRSVEVLPELESVAVLGLTSQSDVELIGEEVEETVAAD